MIEFRKDLDSVIDLSIDTYGDYIEGKTIKNNLENIIYRLRQLEEAINFTKGKNKE